MDVPFGSHPFDAKGRPIMRLAPEERALRKDRPPRRNPHNTLRLLPHQRMTLPPGQHAGAFREAFTKHPSLGYSFGNHPDMSPLHQAELETLLRKHHQVFAYKAADLTGFQGDSSSQFSVMLTTGESIFTKPRRKSPMEKEIIDKKCQELADLGFIVPAPLPARAAVDPTLVMARAKHLRHRPRSSSFVASMGRCASTRPVWVATPAALPTR